MESIARTQLWSDVIQMILSNMFAGGGVRDIDRKSQRRGDGDFDRAYWTHVGLIENVPERLFIN